MNACQAERAHQQRMAEEQMRLQQQQGPAAGPLLEVKKKEEEGECRRTIESKCDRDDSIVESRPQSTQSTASSVQFLQVVEPVHRDCPSVQRALHGAFRCDSSSNRPPLPLRHSSRLPLLLLPPRLLAYPVLPRRSSMVLLLQRCR